MRQDRVRPHPGRENIASVSRPHPQLFHVEHPHRPRPPFPRQLSQSSASKAPVTVTIRHSSFANARPPLSVLTQPPIANNPQPIALFSLCTFRRALHRQQDQAAALHRATARRVASASGTGAGRVRRNGRRRQLSQESRAGGRGLRPHDVQLRLAARICRGRRLPALSGPCRRPRSRCRAPTSRLRRPRRWTGRGAGCRRGRRSGAAGAHPGPRRDSRLSRHVSRSADVVRLDTLRGERGA